MKTTQDSRNEVLTVVVFARSTADALETTESHRRHFSCPKVAARWARRQVTVFGGYHAAALFAGRPTNPLAEHLASFESAARKRFLACVAQSKSIAEARAMYTAVR